MSILTTRQPGKKVLTTGDMAVARGALEAGIGYFSTYPGTPASQVGDSIAEVWQQLEGLYFEYSMNEKVALDGAIGAAWVGIRAMAAMKHLGLNVAADSLHHASYRDLKGLVILNGGDPGMQSSQTEQDNRFYSLHTHFPIIEPSSVQEAKDFTIKAFELSEEFTIPFMLNLPSALLHGLGELELGELPKVFPAKGRFTSIYQNTKWDTEFGRPGRHKVLLDREAAVTEYAATSKLNRIIKGNADWGIITGSVAFGYAIEALQMLGIKEVPILKLGIAYPLSPDLIQQFIQGLKKVIIVEELEGFLETLIKAMAYDMRINIPIVGKEVISPIGMLSSSRVAIDLSKHLGVPLPPQFDELPEAFKESTERLATALALPGGDSVSVPGFEPPPPRQLSFCTGCPHRGTSYAIKRATKGRVLLGGDIGCYAMIAFPPFKLVSWRLCMGAGIGAGQGVAHKAPDTPVMAIIGDSTLFHAGLPAVLNAAYHNANILLVVMDNRWVSMTGHQPTPSTEMTVTGQALPHVDIAKLLKGLGVKWVRKADPFQPDKMEKVIAEALKKPGLKAIVASGECALQNQRRKRQLKVPTEVRYQIDQEKCKLCDICFADFACPAIVTQTDKQGSLFYQIDQGLCVQCGACVSVCTFEAILAIPNGG